MSFFRKKSVAVLLTVIIVLVATLLSFNIRFGGKCKDVINGFYDGVYYNGEVQESCASHLRKIIGASEGVSDIAKAYNIDTAHLDYAIENLTMSFNYSYDMMSHIYYSFTDLVKEEKDMQSRLKDKELTAEQIEALNNYTSIITNESLAIDTSGYNESVREFLRNYDRFPVSFLAPFANVHLPEYFM